MKFCTSSPATNEPRRRTMSLLKSVLFTLAIVLLLVVCTLPCASAQSAHRRHTSVDVERNGTSSVRGDLLEARLEARLVTSSPARFAEAVRLACAHRRANAYETLICPPKEMVGKRPTSHTATLIGTTCEPWIQRDTLEVLNHVLHGGMHALEWSTGSSTTWLLPHVASLVSIEHETGWLNDVRSAVTQQWPWLASRWTGVAVPNTKPWPGDGSLEEFRDYVAWPREHGPRQLYDFVSVDGRARSDCLREVLKHGLVSHAHGILMLDNAERAEYREAADLVPTEWLCASFAHRIDETVLWMRCTGGTLCVEAQARIDAELEALNWNGVRGGDTWRRHQARRLAKANANAKAPTDLTPATHRRHESASS
mmetsp:Transcript_17098/g.51124  ORF Transcript_17098/g.51124 Transcript_17098/m.51124 type:complete len:368 (+) Transcript_17098:3-1106(+)